MNLTQFLQTWRGTSLENRISRIALLVLATAVLILANLVGQVERTVVLVPPVLEEEVTIARDRASREVYEAWGMYVAMLIGNVTPQTVDTLVKVIDPLLESALKHELLGAMRKQVEEIKRERVSMSFVPRAITYDPETKLVYVSGNHKTEGPGAPPVQTQRTYELRVEFRNYRPMITHLDAYTGSPKQVEKEKSEQTQ